MNEAINYICEQGYTIHISKVHGYWTIILKRNKSHYFSNIDFGLVLEETYKYVLELFREKE